VKKRGRVLRLVVAPLVLLVLGSGSATATQESEAESDVNPQAMEIIQRMSEYLANGQVAYTVVNPPH
jgi:outer membrane biogenesis lipoprotein LolB